MNSTIENSSSLIRTPQSFLHKFLMNLWSKAKVLPWLCIANLTLLVTLSVIFRVVDIDHLPGVNGDEALDAVQVRDVLAGRPTILKMPTGRLLSPIYGVLLMATDAIRTPSFFSLRLPALIAGLAMIPLAFFLFWRILGPATALLLVLITATAPVNLAYSRVGIEQCLMALAGMVVLHFALKTNWWGLFWAFLFALLVHPINVFLVPIILGPLVARVVSHTKWNRHKKYLILLTAITVLYFGIFIEILILPAHYAKFVDIQFLVTRLTKPQDFFYFVKYFIRLLTGVMAIEQYASPLPVALARTIDIVGGLTVLLTIGFGSFRLVKKKQWLFLGLVAGWASLVVGYYLITGADAVAPGVARYALVLLMPSYLVLVICGQALMQTRSFSLQATVVSVVGWLFLAQFGVFYYQSIRENNSTAFRAYVTGDREPKAMALQLIQWDSMKRGKDPKAAVIVTEDWWTYWPLRYLTIEQPEGKTYLYEEHVKSLGTLKAVMDGGAYLVGFPETGLFEKNLHSLYRPGEIQRFNLPGYGKKPVLSVWRIAK